MFDDSTATGLGNIVEIAQRIWTIEVESRRNLPALHGDDSSRDSRRSACALRMSDLRFQRRHRNPVRPFLPQSQFQGARFDAVVEVG